MNFHKASGEQPIIPANGRNTKTVNSPFIKSQLVRIGLLYGAIGGGIVIILIIGLFLLGRNPLLDIRVVDAIILAVFIVFSMREFRERYNGGTLHYWQGVSIGMITYFTTAVISAVFMYIFIRFIQPDLLQYYIDNRLVLLEQNREQLIQTINEQAYAKAVEGIKVTTAMDLALDDLLKKSFIGLFLTIIIAVILRKNPTNQ